MRPEEFRIIPVEVSPVKSKQTNYLLVDYENVQALDSEQLSSGAVCVVLFPGEWQKELAGFAGELVVEPGPAGGSSRSWEERKERPGFGLGRKNR